MSKEKEKKKKKKGFHVLSESFKSLKKTQVQQSPKFYMT